MASGKVRWAIRLGLVRDDISALGHDAANRFRRGQIRGAIAQMRTLLVSNTFFAPAMAFQAWNLGRNEAVILWTSAMLAMSWWLFFSWSRRFETDGRQSDMTAFVRETFVNGLMWSIGMMLFFPVVDGDQKAIITAIMAGSLALGTVGFSRAPVAAFAYLGVQTIGNTAVAGWSAFANGSGTDALIAVLCVAAGAGVFSTTLERSRASAQAFLDHEKLAEKSEVVDLLLKDYEEQATEWLWHTDSEGFLLSAPQQILDMLAIPKEDLDQSRLFVAISEQTTAESAADVARLRNAVEDRQEFHDITLTLTDPQNNQLRWISMRGRPQFGDTGFKGFRGLFADATVATEANRHAEYLATRDSLTGLLNRNSVQTHLSSLNPHTDSADCILIDLDGFKQVNDSYGHGIGDILLKDVSDRLLRHLGSGQMIARLGGDEFFVLMNAGNLPPQSDLMTACQDLVRTLSAPYLIEQFDISISASIGVARYPEDTPVGKDILLQADLALYAAKNGGRNQSRKFVPAMQAEMQERLLVTERLKKAIRSRQVIPHYQPQFSLYDGSLVGFEALARWTDSELGVIGPDIFVPIAEQTGLIVELGEQLLRQACRDACSWGDDRTGRPGPIVSVNLSPVQFARMDVTEMVRGVLEETGLPPERLEIELTESVLIVDTTKIAAKLRVLSSMGVTVALDDFGTGYSSLSYLKSLPLNRLKIDRSFISDLHEPSAQPIVNTIIQLGKNLGLSVIAEGVETETQMTILSRMGCNDAQGFFFSRPTPADEALDQALRSQSRKRSYSRTGNNVG